VLVPFKGAEKNRKKKIVDAAVGNLKALRMEYIACIAAALTHATGL